MADSSLDDFFAKKDKSKKKSKSKMTPGDVLAKSGEEPKKVKKKKDKEQPGGLGLSAVEDTTKKTEDDDWVDFAEQKEVDYTGLRIQTLQMKEEEEKEAAESEGEGEGAEGEEGRESTSGPWNTAAAATPTVAPVAAAPAPPTPEPEEKKENTAPKKYIPPAQRQAALKPAANPISRRANKKAPNIQSEEDFPTLGGTPQAPGASAWGASAKRYENSGAGDIESNPGQRRGVNLSLENKFAALQD